MASKYWEHRAELRQLAYDRSNNKVVADVSRVYDRTMRQLNDDINSIIGTYQRKTGLTTREAYDFLNQGVPPGVMDELRSRVAVITDPKQRKRLEVMLSTDAYRARISRLDAIKASTRVGLTEAAEAELGALEPHLKGMIESGYSRTLYDIQKVSYGFAGAGVPRSALDMILRSKWSGEHYSSRIWGNRDAMAQILNRALMEQSTMGKLSDLTMQDVRGMVNLDKWRSQLTSKFKDEAQYAKYAANRLIRTESAYVANQATALAYEECEIERYEYISVLDSRTSKKCSGLDGQIFKVSEKEVGVNFPPGHAHCRSSTRPVLDTQNRRTMQRRGEGKDGESVVLPADMNYAEWKRWQNNGCPDIAKWRRTSIATKDTNPTAKPTKIAFVPATTQAEADKYLRGLGYESEYEKKRTSVDIANTVNREIGRFKETFGDQLKMRGVKIWPKRDAEFAAAYSPAFNNVYLYKVQAKDSLSKWAKMVNENHKIGAWSTGAVEHPIRHELGHAVHYGVGLKTNKDALELLRQQGILQSGLTTTDFSVAAYKEMGRTTQQLLDDVKNAGETLSAYGLTSVDEMVAESIAEYMGGSPRKFATSVVKTLMGW